MRATDAMEYPARHRVAEPQFTFVVAAQDDAIRHDFALRDRRTEAPCCVQNHVAVGGAAQAAAGDSGRHQRLNEDRHRRVRGACIMGCHVAQHARRPECRPAGAYRRNELGLILQAEVAFELPGETRSETILHQRRGAHHHKSAGRLEERSLRVEQRIEHFWHDRMIEKAELHREGGAARRPGFHRVHATRGLLQAQRRNLNAIRLGVDAKAFRNGQACASEAGEVRGLGTEAVRVGGLGRREGDDQLAHEWFRRAEFIRPPTPQREVVRIEFAPAVVMTCHSSNIPASDRRR